MEAEATFSPSEWRTLRFAPLWVFLAVVGAGRDIDSKELRTLTRELEEGTLYHEPLIRDVLRSLVDEFDHLVSEFGGDARDSMSGLAEVAAILDRQATREAAWRFKNAMLLIGRNVAEALGRKLLGSWTRTEEKAALNQVAAALGVARLINRELETVKQKPGAFKRLSKRANWTLVLVVIGVVSLGVGIGGFVVFLIEPEGQSGRLGGGLSLLTCPLGTMALLGAPLYFAISKLSSQVHKTIGIIIGGIILLCPCATTIASLGYSILSLQEPPSLESVEVKVTPTRVVQGRVSEDVAKDLAFGDEVKGKIEDDVVWTFEGKVGQIVSIAMNEDRSGLDTILTLTGPYGDIIAENDDTSEGMNSQISQVVLPEDGTYVVTPGGYSDSGAYTITLMEVEIDESDRDAAAYLYSARGDAYAQQRDYEQAVAAYGRALEDYLRAMELDPDHASDYCNQACWFGSLLGYEAEVLEVCEGAVQLASSDQKAISRDSRGLARALTGDYAGAIEDFQFFTDWSKAKGWYEQYGSKREAWIAELEAERNPFDEATLDALRNE